MEAAKKKEIDQLKDQLNQVTKKAKDFEHRKDQYKEANEELTKKANAQIDQFNKTINDLKTAATKNAQNQDGKDAHIAMGVIQSSRREEELTEALQEA